MGGFQPAVQRQIESKSSPTRIYTGPRPAECSHYLEHTANWQWDLAMYLTQAEFRIYDAVGIAGSATYNTRRDGGRLNKFGSTAEKICPLIEQLFGAVRVGQTGVPVQNKVALTADTIDRSARIQALQHLYGQGLITDEDLSSRRQVMLDEI